MMPRRDFLKQAGVAAAAQTALRAAAANAIVVDPRPLFDISPWLYMQFMEPLGVTDSSVEAVVGLRPRRLAKGFRRYGQGSRSRCDALRRTVQPPLQVARRRGAGRPNVPRCGTTSGAAKETNRVGTHEFVDFCRRVGAEPFYCVNFLSDGEKRFLTTAGGQSDRRRQGGRRLGFLRQRSRQQGTQAERRGGAA